MKLMNIMSGFGVELTALRHDCTSEGCKYCELIARNVATILRGAINTSLPAFLQFESGSAADIQKLPELKDKEQLYVECLPTSSAPLTVLWISVHGEQTLLLDPGEMAKFYKIPSSGSISDLVPRYWTVST